MIKINPSKLKSIIPFHKLNTRNIIYRTNYNKNLINSILSSKNDIVNTYKSNCLTSKFFSSSKGSSNGNSNNDDTTNIGDNTLESLSKELLKYEKFYKQRVDFPIDGKVMLFPSKTTHLYGSKGPIALPNEILERLIPNASGKYFLGVFLIKEEFLKENIVHSVDTVHKTGVLVELDDIGGYYMFQVKNVIRIKHLVTNKPPYTVQVEMVPMKNDENDPKVLELKKEIVDLVKTFSKKYPNIYTYYNLEDFQQILEKIPVSLYQTLIINYYGFNDYAFFQSVIEDNSYVGRLEKVHQFLLKEERSFIEQEAIHNNLRESLLSHRKEFLTQEMEKIKDQLGEKDEKEKVTQKYQTKLDNLKIDDVKKKLIQDEINKLSSIETSSVEFNNVRNYLDWLTNLPWNQYTDDLFDLKHSKEVLDSDHYGLEDIKQRILEFISVGHLKGSINGKIICFIGPPGTGKTTIAKSIAKCLNREFFRFSVGGLFDEGEIKGHRRTYVGAMPGKLIQCMKQVKSSNPVILIDEIDKIGKRNLGDPSSALLEVLDPEQNSQFTDHFLDVPYDLSKVLFICTANSDQTIPGPLLDRMEVINLSGYIEAEQIQILKQYIIPKTLLDCGIKPEQLTISEEVIKQLVKFYSREVGVRELEHLIEKIMRKAALKLVTSSDPNETINVNLDNLEDYLGIPQYSSDRYYDVTPIGVVNGLAWSQRGGSTLYIESTAQPKNSLPPAPRLRSTGKLGDVMTESTSIAYTYAKNFLDEIDPTNKFFESAAIHMHAPQGGISKDGPSAGVTMVTSLISLALNEPVLNDLGMTGEITITGKVITIGGVKEKIIAAKRSGLNTVILPENNKFDFDDLPKHIKEGINIKYVKYYKDVFKVAFPNKTDIIEKIKND